MPRPADGYRNRAGEQVPGVTDITGRFKESGGLINWAYGQGRKGVPLYDRSALDIGTIVHRLCEMDLAGHTNEELRDYAEASFKTRPQADIQAARNAFRAYRQWVKAHDVRVIAQETSLVSETHQYGGTPDLIAVVDGKVAIVDFKTSASCRIYPDMKVAMGGHAELWNEHNPDRKVMAAHLILLAKNGDGVQAHAFGDLQTEWQIFHLWLKAWRLEKGTGNAKPPRPDDSALMREANQRVGKWPASMFGPPTPATEAERLLAEMIKTGVKTTGRKPLRLIWSKK